jgi:hypothetical protein
MNGSVKSKWLALFALVALVAWGLYERRDAGPMPGAAKPSEATRVSESITASYTTFKAIDGGYRHFGVLHNNGAKGLSGAVEIRTVNRNGDLAGGEMFTINGTLGPGATQPFYIDGSTGPPSVHGEYGIVGFRVTGR